MLRKLTLLVIMAILIFAAIANAQYAQLQSSSGSTSSNEAPETRP